MDFYHLYVVNIANALIHLSPFSSQAATKCAQLSLSYCCCNIVVDNCIAHPRYTQNFIQKHPYTHPNLQYKYTPTHTHIAAVTSRRKSVLSQTFNIIRKISYTFATFSLCNSKSLLKKKWLNFFAPRNGST